MNRLKELREKQGLTLDDIELKTGIKRATFSRYENEKSEPKLATWRKLADYFSVSVPYLQGLTDYPSAERPQFFDDDKDVFDNKGEFTKEFKVHLGKMNAYENQNKANYLSSRLHELLTTEDSESDELVSKIDNNLSNISDRLLIYHLLNGVDSGVAAILLTDVGLKKHKDELKNVAIKLDELNDYLDNLSNEDLKNDND